MAAGEHNITIEQGATFQMPITWSTGVTPTPVNLTGYTARMHVRKTHASDTAVLTLTTENGGITLGGALGTIAILATATQTATITIKSGVYDLELVSGGGTVTRLLEGSVTITPEVTR
jgi:hypothetical protein